MKAADMPTDAAGNVADIVMDANSIISRMNLGTAYEHYIGSAARDASKIVRRKLGIDAKKTSQIRRELDIVSTTQAHLVDEAFQFILGFLQRCSPRQYEAYQNTSNKERVDILAGIIEKGLYLYIPTDNEIPAPDIVRALQQYCPPTYGPITYVGDSGRRVTTEYPVRIGPMYIMLLEKIADDCSSVSSGKLQHFGILSPMTRSEKYAYPFRNSPVRTVGEPEGRNDAAYCGREAIAETMDRNNNPTTHKYIYRKLLRAERPTAIEAAVERDVIPLGSSKPLQLVSHIAMCAGWRPVYEPETSMYRPEF